MRLGGVSGTALLLWALILGGALAVAAERLWLLRDLPLWVDETWTGTIVSQPSWSAFVREAWLDPNAPLYYVVMRLWTEAAGLSNLALRIPSLVFVAAAAALPLVWRVPELSREARATWAALIFLWVPSIIFSLDARSYALLLLVATAQAIAYVRLIEAPTLQRAALWSLLAALSILTHYFAGLLAGVQGLAFLYRHRGAALRTWPAALTFVPAFACLLYHLPRLLHWARPEIAWYGKVTGATAWELPAFVMGPVVPLFLPLVVVLLIGARFKTAPAGRDEPESPANALWWAVGTGLVALLLAGLLGALRPMLTLRYLTPIVPLALLGLVLAARGAKRAHVAYLLLTGLYLAFAMKPAMLQTLLRERSEAGYERAAEFLIAARPERLVFAADAPGSKHADPHSLEETGAFFFRRAGLDVDTASLLLDPAVDPHGRLFAHATGPRPAILWFYLDQGSAAAAFPPAIARLRPDWACMHSRYDGAGVIACAPRRLFAERAR